MFNIQNKESTLFFKYKLGLFVFSSFSRPIFKYNIMLCYHKISTYIKNIPIVFCLLLAYTNTYKMFFFIFLFLNCITV